MTKKYTRVTVYQFCALFFLSRIFGLLTFINDPGAELSAKNGSLLFLPFFLFGSLFALPIVLLTNRLGAEKTQTEDLLGTKAAAPLFCAYGIFFLLQGSLGAALLDRFIGETMFQTSGHPILMFFFCGLALLTAKTGAETPLRAAPPLLLLTLFSFLLIAVATISYFEPENLFPSLIVVPKDLLKNGALAAMRTAEPAALLIYAPNLKGRKATGITVAIFALGATASLLFTLITGVTGAFGETQTFQLFTLATLAELGTVERMDDILCAIWIFTAFLRTVFFLCAAERCFSHMPFRSKKSLLAVLSGLALFAVYLSLTGNTAFRVWIEEHNGNVCLCSIFVFLLPLSMLVFDEIIKRKRGKAG